nr:DUF4013 domain-containing protein [uncultured Methanoregula sp.]
MDYSLMLDESFAYAKEGIWSKWTRWLLLIVSMIIFPLILGYMVRIYRGEKPAPELKEWGSMFVDGLKLFVVELVYAAPVILLIIIAFLPLLSSLVTSGAFYQDFSTMSESQMSQWFMSHPEFLSAAGFMLLFILVAIIIAIIIGIFSFLGVIRFARTGCMSEAFNFSAILAQIRRTGWLNYIIALLVIGVIGFLFGMVVNLFSFIPVVGDILHIIVMLVLYVPFILFTSRYAVQVYEAAEEKS